MKDLYSIDRPFVLKARVKAQAVEIRQLKATKRKLLHDARHRLHDQPQDQTNQRTLACHLGELAPSSLARYTLLAYALVRGKTYIATENCVREGNAPRPEWIGQQAFSDFKNPHRQVAYVQQVQDWLKASTAAQQTEQPAQQHAA